MGFGFYLRFTKGLINLMARKTTKATPPAPQETALATRQNVRPVALPIPEGWYDLNIYDVDPEYHSQSSAAVFVVLKLRMNGSLRYKERTLSLFIGEAMEGTSEGRTFPSQRAQCIERFGIDPFTKPDQYLDLVVRGHVTINNMPGTNQQVNRVTSIYPKVVRDNKRPENNDLQEEIPF